MLKNHVPEISLCQKWKELGGRQDTVFSWVSTNEGKNWNVFVHHEEDSRVHIKAFSAPLASEMMEWLPKYIKSYWLIITKSIIGGPYLVAYEDDHHKHLKEFTGNSLPNALMQMCISRKEEEDGKA